MSENWQLYASRTRCSRQVETVTFSDFIDAVTKSSVARDVLGRLLYEVFEHIDPTPQGEQGWTAIGSNDRDLFESAALKFLERLAIDLTNNSKEWCLYVGKK